MCTPPPSLQLCRSLLDLYRYHCGYDNLYATNFQLHQPFRHGNCYPYGMEYLDSKKLLDFLATLIHRLKGAKGSSYMNFLS
jgi:hypothetical protein